MRITWSDPLMCFSRRPVCTYISSPFAVQLRTSLSDWAANINVNVLDLDVDNVEYVSGMNSKCPWLDIFHVCGYALYPGTLVG